jgi:hypothetical protein
MSDKVNQEKTAIDWLFIQLYEKFEMKGNGKEMNDIFQKAKAMEKEQITKAWDDGDYAGDYAYFHSKETGRDLNNGEQYYNETYNK